VSLWPGDRGTKYMLDLKAV